MLRAALLRSRQKICLPLSRSLAAAAGPSTAAGTDRGSLADGQPKTVVAVLYSAGPETAQRQPKLLGCAENGLGLREWLEGQVGGWWGGTARVGVDGRHAGEQWPPWYCPQLPSSSPLQPSRLAHPGLRSPCHQVCNTPFLHLQGHRYIVTSSKDGPDSELERLLPDADVIITTWARSAGHAVQRAEPAPAALRCATAPRAGPPNRHPSPPKYTHTHTNRLPACAHRLRRPFHPGYLTGERIAKAGKLKLALTAGIGSDHVDLQAAKEAGITVAEVTGGPASACQGG